MKQCTPWSIQTVQEEQEQNKSSGNKETDQAETGEAITSPDHGRIDYSSESWNRFFSLTMTELLEVKSEYLGTFYCLFPILLTRGAFLQHNKQQQIDEVEWKYEEDDQNKVPKTVLKQSASVNCH